MVAPRIDRADIGILLVDVQPFFLEAAFTGRPAEREALEMRLEHLLMTAGWMDLPLLATFEKPTEANGELPPRLAAVFPEGGARVVKNYFGSMSEPEIRDGVAGLGVGRIAVAGAETDVCVLQTVLGLLDEGYGVFVLEDCLFTTEPSPGPALRRMYAAGAVPCTLKTMLYELVECVEGTAWYPEGWAGKDGPGAEALPEGFIPPEEWPPWKPKI